ncbi:MAG TPA: SulP family inorganic anion transporter [Anaerolineales bacterium]|nr:SulP family inorganic anion transporter [Anaerolineales bacterium]
MKSNEFFKQFHPSVLLPSLTAGLIAAIVTISLEISLAALIFSGDLSQFLAGGIGLMLFGAFVMGIVVALTTSLPGMVGVPQDTPAAILGLVAAGIAVSMKSSTPSAIYVTVVAAIMLTSLLAAVFFLLLGRFKASGFVRYIPYPVVGGFLAGTGWLMTKGAIGVMVAMPLTIANLPRLLAPAALAIWVPGAIFAIALLLVLRKYSHFLITPGALILATGLFYAYLFFARIPVAAAGARGWLLGPFPSGGLYQPLTIQSFSMIDWKAILQHVDKIAAILVLSVVSLLLNASGLEIAVKRDIDLNRELLTAGFANLAGGLGGSPVGYQALSLSALSYRLGAKSRLVNLVSALLCGAALFFGASMISYFPRPVLGGMLLFVGLNFLVDWLIDARKLLPTVDYLLVWAILIVIASVGFLEGIGVGILIAAILFVVTYSRVNAIKNILSGDVYHSNVDRPKVHRDLLNQKGAQIHILRLQGFLFFGTIQTVLDEIRQRLTKKDRQPLKYIVLDFQRVTRLDSSAVFGINRLKQLAQANSALMVWTNVSTPIRRQLERGGLVDETDDSFIILPTLDHGVEWCENRILAEQGITDLTGVFKRMEGQLKHVFPGLEAVDRLMEYFEPRKVEQGEYLMRQGDPPSDMYFVEHGLITVQLKLPDGKILRLRTIRGGATVGEIGLYLGATRSADVVASQPSTIYRLSAQSLKEMREKDPEVAAHLHEWVARLLAERLSDNNRTIEALMD